MKIFLFVDNDTNAIQNHVANALDKEFFFMVDSVHIGDLVWLARNFEDIPHRFYTYLGDGSKLEHPQEWTFWNCSNLTDQFQFFPTFIVCFDVDQVVSDLQWKKMDYYFLLRTGIVDRGGDAHGCAELMEMIEYEKDDDTDAIFPLIDVC